MWSVMRTYKKRVYKSVFWLRLGRVMPVEKGRLLASLVACFRKLVPYKGQLEIKSRWWSKKCQINWHLVRAGCYWKHKEPARVTLAVCVYSVEKYWSVWVWGWLHVHYTKKMFGVVIIHLVLEYSGCLCIFSRKMLKRMGFGLIACTLP